MFCRSTVLNFLTCGILVERRREKESDEEGEGKRGREGGREGDPVEAAQI